MRLFLLSLSTLGIFTASTMTHAQPTVQITTVVNFGDDIGQNFGTLFEARNAKGDLVAGAGFAGVYNTLFRHDRHTLQFFIRPAEFSATVEALPRPSTDHGCYLFDYNGRIYAARQLTDPLFRWWDQANRKWVEDPDFRPDITRNGDVVMNVAGKPLTCIDSQVQYDGKMLLDKPDVGHYHHFYYAAGYLTFFHNNRDGTPPPFSRLYACKWDPKTNQPLDLKSAAVLELTHPGETPFAIGQLDGKILNSSNRGGVYLFDGKKWTELRTPQPTGSYQLYSMLNWNDKLLLAHYPSGHLHEFDGKTITELDQWPPLMPGVSGSSREAQTTCIYGGDIFVGVWPWAELWRLDANADAWSFVQRMFTKPALTTAVTHPWDQEMLDFNAKHGTTMDFNSWGERVTGLVPMGDSLYVSTSAKAPWARDDRLEFLTDEVLQEYGRVYRMTVPGVLSVPIQWSDKPTTLQFTIANGRMTITQDGQPLGDTALPAAPTTPRDWKYTWSKGVFGPLGGHMTNHSVQPVP
jgi:hypothetical protein